MGEIDTTGKRCEACGRPFVTKYPTKMRTQRYCSRHCAQQARWHEAHLGPPLTDDQKRSIVARLAERPAGASRRAWALVVASERGVSFNTVYRISSGYDEDAQPLAQATPGALRRRLNFHRLALGRLREQARKHLEIINALKAEIARRGRAQRQEEEA